MDKQVTFTHTARLENGAIVTFDSCWPAHEVVGGLTHCNVNGSTEFSIVSSVIKTTAKTTSNAFSLY